MNKMLKISAVSAILALSFGLTAFAGEWKEDKNGWYYVTDSGSWAGMGWFTDPATGIEYYLDPDGYMMTHTYMEGYWLDDSGAKHEKTAERLEAEANRAQRTSTKATPSKQATQVQEKAMESLTTGVADSTARDLFTAQMKKLYNSAFVELRTALDTKGVAENYEGSITKNANNWVYYYDNKSDIRVLYGETFELTNKSSKNFVEEAIRVNYNRNLVHGGESQDFDAAYKKILTSALGPVKGEEVYAKVMALEIGTDASLDDAGTTDFGNTYVLKYRTNNALLTVTCQTEKTPAESAAESAENTEETAAEEPAQTTAVITAGLSRQQTAEETAAEETAAAETAEDSEEVSSFAEETSAE